MSAEKGSPKADTLIKVVLVSCISLLAFSVGAYLGKQMSDTEYRRMALEGEYKAERSVASTDDHGDASEKISEEEVESLTEEFVNKEKAAHDTAAADEHGEKAGEHHDTETAAHDDGYKTYKRGESEHAEAKPEEHHAKVTPKKADATHAVAEKVANNKAPTDGKKESRKPSSTLPSVASSAIGKYTVQVASYVQENEAKEHAATLKGKGFNAFYLSADVNGRTWFRVLVGLFNNSKSANEFRAQFMKEANTKSAIVQKIVK